VRKAFKYRLYPTTEQEQAMAEMLDTHRHLYNRALAERKTTWEERRESVSYGQQSAHLKDERTTNPFLARTNFSRCQATVRRLDRAFQAFFRRVKSGESPGYPRFKGRTRFDTVEFPPYGDGCKLDGALVSLQHIGRIKIKLHRPVEGAIKTISFKREADGWHVVFSCEVLDAEVQPSPLPATGIDLGLKAFLVTADGREIPPPRYYRKAQKALIPTLARHLSFECMPILRPVRRPRSYSTSIEREIVSDARSARWPASRRGALAARRRCCGSPSSTCTSPTSGATPTTKSRANWSTSTA
jgi:putative transposase